MSFQPTPKQTLVMWNLLITGDEPAISKVKPELKPAERQPLIEAGLIELVKRGRSNHIALTDKAWQWASEHFDVELSISNFATPVLQRLLKQLGIYLKAQKISLAEFLTYSPENTDPEPTVSEEEIERKIAKAYLTASGGEYNVRVRLSQLRQLLSNIPQLEMDRALTQMVLAGKIILMRLDDPQEIHPEDERASISLGGQKNHIMYMKE